MAFGLLTNLLFFTSLAAFWTYLAEIAVSLGNSAERVASTVSTAFLIGGAFGSIHAALAASRIASRMMIVFGTAGLAVSVSMLVRVSGLGAFAATAVAFLLRWFLTYPFLMARSLILTAQAG